MQRNHFVHNHSTHKYSTHSHTKAFFAATLGLLVFVAGCGKSDPIASAETESTSESPVVTEVSTESSEAEPTEAADAINENSDSETSEAEASTPAPVSDEEAEKFFTVLESTFSDEDKVIHQNVGKEKALELAQAACQDFDQGKSFNEIANDVVGGLQEAGLEGEELQKAAYYSGKVMGVGVAVFCPQYRNQIEG